jgi:hypothetical protein
MKRIVVAVTSITLAWRSPTNTDTPVAKPVPVTVCSVPPTIGPREGSTESGTGAAS